MRDALAILESTHTKEPMSGCWLWTGYVNPGGYGRCCSTAVQNRLVHRESWRVYKGAIPKGLFVLHRCDVRSCINPEHLFLGTIPDNTADMVKKDRQAKGERQALAKLNVEQVRDIRLRRMSGRAYARLYGVSSTSVNALLRGETWRGVDG